MKKLFAVLLALLSPLASGNGYYNHGSYPISGSAATSAGMRAELDLITAGFNLLPTLSGHAGEIAYINAAASALVTGPSATLDSSGNLVVHAVNGNTITTGTGTLTLAAGKTASFADAFSTSGAFPITLTATGSTNVTLPTTGTLMTTTGSTSGTAASWTTARNLAGNSVDGTANVAFANKFIVQGTVDTGLSSAQFLGALGTGLVKNTVTTGVLSIASAASDYVAPSAYASANGLTMATARLLGRTTAATGAAEEISIGSGLSMSAGSLTATGSGGTVTSIAVTTANGVSGSSSGGTTPSLTITLGAITPSSVNGNTITTGTGTLTLATGKTLTANNTLTLAGTDSTTMTFPPASASVGYINIPQNSQSANYTTVLADQGKHIFHPSTDANARTFTIDSNANVAYPVGTAITFINMTSQVVSIAITTDTMYLAGTGTTGTRSLAQYGSATAIKIDSTHWIISGAGIT